MGRMEDMHNANFVAFFYYAKDYKIVANGIATIAKPSQHGVSAKFMRGGQFFEVCVAFVYAISQFRRRLRVLKFIGDILEGIEQIGIGRWRYDDLIHEA